MTAHPMKLVSSAGALVILLGLTPLPTHAVEAATSVTATQVTGLEARVWIDRGVDPILRHGDRARIYYRTTDDAYVAIFHIDTDGHVRLVHPRDSGITYLTRGTRDYRLLFDHSSYWRVGDDPGVGYFFMIASPHPLDFSRLPYAVYAGAAGYGTGATVYGDPYVVMDEYVSYLIPDWQYVPYALDFTSYQVGGRYDYPRFLCYDCHGYRPYSSWNPYHHACTSFRIVIYSHPYYYPYQRYVGRRVVFVRPVFFKQPRFVFKERAWGEPSAPVVRQRAVVTAPPVADRPGVAGPTVQRRPASVSSPSVGGVQPGRAAPPVVTGPTSTRGSAPGRSPVVGAPARRPTDILPGRPAGATTPTRVTPARGATGTQPPRASTSGRGGRTSPPTIPGTRRPAAVSPPTSGSGRIPVIGTRPPTGSRPTTATRPSGSSRIPSATRPSTGSSRPPAASRPPTTGRGGGVSARPPTSSRPPVVRTRPPTSGRTGGSSARPPTTGRTGGSSARPPRTGRSGGASARPPTTGRGGGSSARPPRTGRGGGGSTSSPSPG